MLLCLSLNLSTLRAVFTCPVGHLSLLDRFQQVTPGHPPEVPHCLPSLRPPPTLAPFAPSPQNPFPPWGASLRTRLIRPGEDRKLPALQHPGHLYASPLLILLHGFKHQVGDIPPKPHEHHGVLDVTHVGQHHLRKLVQHVVFGCVRRAVGLISRQLVSVGFREAQRPDVCDLRRWDWTGLRFRVRDGDAVVLFCFGDIGVVQRATKGAFHLLVNTPFSLHLLFPVVILQTEDMLRFLKTETFTGLSASVQKTYRIGVSSPAKYVRPQEGQFLPEHPVLGGCDPLGVPQQPPILSPQWPGSPLHLRHCRKKATNSSVIWQKQNYWR